jgi:hypothetical protein
MADPVVHTDPVEEDVSGAPPESAGEDLAVFREDLCGDAVGVEGLEQGIAHRSCSRPGHDLGDYAEARVVVDPGDDRDRHAGGELDIAMTSSCHNSIARDRSPRL